MPSTLSLVQHQTTKDYQQPSSDADTVRALEVMLQLAKAGGVTGIAAVVFCRSKRYTVELTGEGKRNPTYALGAVRLVESDLVRQILADAGGGAI